MLHDTNSGRKGDVDLNPLSADFVAEVGDWMREAAASIS
jgi:hypothetical protein